MDFYSHPGKLLQTHLKEVWNYGQNFSKEDDAIKIVCGTHDFGKYTTYFQNKLKYGTESHLANHAFISALLGAYIAIQTQEKDICLPCFVYHAILCHHGSVDNMEQHFFDDDLLLEGKIKDAEKQRLDMRKNLKQIAEEYHPWGWDRLIYDFFEKANFEKIINELDKRLYRNRKILRKNANGYFQFQKLYSALIAADKLSASDTPLVQEKYGNWEKLNLARVSMIQKNRQEHPSIKKLNQIRETIFESVHKQLEQYGKKASLFSITAPTGTGKTFCGFLAAEKLRDVLQEDRRIIYALPFTSIINQNYEVIFELLKRSEEEFENNSFLYLMKHHHLENVDYQSEYYDLDQVKSEMLMENWSSGIVVTTFVQLMETLISNKNRMLKKFHSFQHSILLLDEVQAFPLELLKVIDFVLHRAVEEMDCKIIMMTATRPILLRDSIELLKNHESYFRMFSRTKLLYQEEKITIADFAEEFLEHMEEKSYLIICNTIQESLDLYEELKNCGRDVCYLSTNLLPIHRKMRIQEVEEKLKREEAFILVSTQSVEAGVDFDFSHVIRDIAPFDSIIQAAGRENRHGKRDREVVEIRCFCNEKGQLYGQMVYGYTIIQCTQGLFRETKEIEEENYLELIETYFSEVSEKINDDNAEEYCCSIERMNYTKEGVPIPIKDFSLIQEKNGYIDVFLQIDENAETVYEAFLRMIQEKDFQKQQQMKRRLKREMAEYTLSIPVKYASRINHMKEEKIWTLPKEGCEEYYCLETGFRRNEEEGYSIF